MGNFSGKYFRAWKIESKGSFKIIDLGDSDKDKDGNYNNFTWFRCLFVSKAAQLDIWEKDTIQINSGKITMEKYNDKWSPKIVVFDAEIIKRNEEPQGQQIQSNNKERFEDSIPF